MITELTVALVVGYLIYATINWAARKRTSLRTFVELSIPGPVPSFLSGNFRDYLRDDLKHETLDRWAREHGPYYGYYQGERPFLVLSDIEDVQEVVSKLGKSFPNRQGSNIRAEPFQSSLLGMRGEQWRNSRRVLTPPFTAHKIALKTTKVTINESVKRLLLALEQQRRTSIDDSIDVLRSMQSVTLDIITKLAFSMDDSSDDLYEENSKLRNLTTDFMENCSPNLVLELTAYFPIVERLAMLAYGIFGGGKLMDTLTEHLNKCVIEYYQKRIRQRFGGPTEAEENDGKVNILDFMLEQQEQGNLTELEIMGNALIILIAGYETTATALTYTLYLLAKNQDIQNRLRAELAAKHTEPDNFCHFDYNRCELLDRVWYESLRLYPPVVTFTTRELDDKIETIQLSTNPQIQITRHMTVQIPTWTIHHDPKYWPEPYKFNPIRENLPIPGASKPNPAFMPFGNGPRNCIGSNLANSEARAVLTALLTQYKVELVQKEEDPKTLDPKTGLLKLKCTTAIVHPLSKVILRFTPTTDL